MGFPYAPVGKESSFNAVDLGSITGLKRPPGGGHGNPLQVFWPGEFHGLCSPWGRKESDMTERLSLTHWIALTVSFFPGISDSKASAYNAGGPGLIPGLGRSPGEGNGTPLQYSCLENPMDSGSW